jgi:hypothetical protein
MEAKEKKEITPKDLEGLFQIKQMRQQLSQQSSSRVVSGVPTSSGSFSTIGASVPSKPITDVNSEIGSAMTQLLENLNQNNNTEEFKS